VQTDNKINANLGNHTEPNKAVMVFVGDIPHPARHDGLTGVG
jgi:hypothetical protein